MNMMLDGRLFSINTQHMSHLMRKPTMWFPIRSNTNQAIQSTKDGKRLDILDLQSRETVLSV